MRDLIYAIQDFFLMLFTPMDAFAKLERSDWWSANIMNWLFMVICIVAMVYWLIQLKIFNKTYSERRDVVSHTFFK